MKQNQKVCGSGQDQKPISEKICDKISRTNNQENQPPSRGILIKYNP
jgi:hypothetical protein